jgi:hypothetical protein
VAPFLVRDLGHLDVQARFRGAALTPLELGKPSRQFDGTRMHVRTRKQWNKSPKSLEVMLLLREHILIGSNGTLHETTLAIIRTQIHERDKSLFRVQIVTQQQILVNANRASDFSPQSIEPGEGNVRFNAICVSVHGSRQLLFCNVKITIEYREERGSQR